MPSLTNIQKMCDCECHDPGKSIMHCMPCCDFSGEQRSPIQLQQRIDELKKRFDFILRLNHGPRCPECGASANDGILCDGCLKLTEHCDCESRFTAPITWRVIK